jgi:hypothetical protein
MIMFKTWLGIHVEITCEECCQELSIHPDLRRALGPEDVAGDTVSCTYCGREVRKEEISGT